MNLLYHNKSLSRILLTFISYLILSTSVYYTCSYDAESHGTSIHNYTCCTSQPCCDKLERNQILSLSTETTRKFVIIKLIPFSNALPGQVHFLKIFPSETLCDAVPKSTILNIHKLYSVYIC